LDYAIPLGGLAWTLPLSSKFEAGKARFRAQAGENIPVGLKKIRIAIL